jgi:hypothetical protein
VVVPVVVRKAGVTLVPVETRQLFQPPLMSWPHRCPSGLPVVGFPVDSLVAVEDFLQSAKRYPRQ